MSRSDEIADTLQKYAEFLQLDGQSGRATGYDRAARTMRQARHITPDPAQMEGIGEGVRATITEYQRTGEISELTTLEDEYSYYDELRDVRHIGPERAQTLHEKFNIETVDDLILVGDDLTMVRGVGPKTTEKIMSSATNLAQTDG